MSNDKKYADKAKALLEKYGSDASKLAEAHAELEERLGSQGLELGDLRKKTEEANRNIQQYAAYVQNAKPVVDWYSQHQDKIRDMWQKAQQQPAATTHTNGVSILTPEEQQHLYAEAAKYVREKDLGPWTQDFAQKAEAYIQNVKKEMNDQFEKQQKAYAQVWWKTLEHAVPQDKIAALKSFHEEAGKYADPSKIDPFKFAEEAIDTKAKLATYEEKIKTYEKEKEEREKALTPSLGNGQGLFPKTEDADKNKIPTNRDERFKAVLDDVKAAHGNEGMDALFKPNTLR